MESKIIIVAETGSDLPPELAKELGVHLVPMHVTLGEEVRDDGTFPPEEVCRYYERTGTLPKTCASSPYDFSVVFDRIHFRWPEKQILYLAYSAVTTASFQNAIIAAEGRNYVTGVDTKQVSVGQEAVVIETAGLLEQKPDISIEELAEAAKSISGKIQMCFVPETLEYLKAGGRVSNAGAMIGNLLSIHPCIRIENGKLLAREKYRGGMKKIAAKVIRTHAERYPLKKDKLYLLCSPGLSKDIKETAEREAKGCGFQKINWMQTGCVITSHAGPGCFGVVGMEI